MDQNENREALRAAVGLPMNKIGLLYYAAREKITELERQVESQRRYIEELEKQLEYANPGIVKEVQEFLEVKEGR